MLRCLLRSIDTCQNKASADQYHVAISRVYSSSGSHVFVKLKADQELVSQLDRGLMSGRLVENGEDCPEAGLRIKS